MPKYIDADEFKRTVFKAVTGTPGDDPTATLEVALALMRFADETPAAEIAHERSGEWLIEEFGDKAQCSVCKKTFSGVYDAEGCDHFCRNCGAWMKGIKVVD